ncbi:Fe3+-hydroxamate ABC transporter permease FhuB [Azorhizobium oxalatiphilum]|uniref:Fe3+-hydroxamate ABC transporter permease FhuB n=1 Tax=Azorhizobium oxalatiphilum TaxID=980631 RepID=A0A917F9E9_9HYPH|nr:Fe(3+)-hydroxamate ABC transporter permease FhuB [Azorhizobium oxalatiphilum]GGF58239.1 Fe3+-hydroxamate ABC transporter permease FhuB [Azorhizobium oxalatiphilum]
MASLPARTRRPVLPILPALAGALGLAALGLCAARLAVLLPVGLWSAALTGENRSVVALVFADMAVPRLIVCWLVGASLGVAAVLFQQVLRTSLADGATLGVSSGAALALAAAGVFAPSLLDHGQEAVALTGAGGAVLLVLALARRAGFSSVSLLLTGLTVSLLCGAAGAALAVLNHETLTGLFVWQSGALVQNGWANVRTLLPRLALGAGLAVLLVRPLEALALGDGAARALGVPVQWLRGAVVALAVALAASCVSAVGVIGFIGLAAANLARLTGARTLRQALGWSSLLGALLLWLTDEIVQQPFVFRGNLPTGSATALLGAPLLLLLVLRQRAADLQPGTPPGTHRTAHAGALLLALGAGLACLVAVALVWGRAADGWQMADPEILLLRLPRVLAALGAGGMLAVAGVLMQRMTGHPMASPEVLGVSSGAALGVVLLFFAAPSFPAQAMTGAALAGAAATLAVILLLSRHAASRILLGGMALATLFSACASVLLASGDPRTAVLLAWMSGSTYRVTLADAAICLAAAVLVISGSLLALRWLGLLSLGEAGARGLGLATGRARVVLLLLTALATAVATLTIGPLSFVGLMAPHLVRSLGITRPLQQVAGSALAGAGLMVAADFIGRTLLFPWQLPAGMVSALIGGPLFLWLLGRRR